MWTDSFQINNYEQLNYNITVEDVKDLNDTCLYSKSNIVNLSGTPPYEIIWESGTQGIDEYENLIYDYPANHSVTIIDGNGCFLAKSVNNDQCDTHPYGTITVSPNPTSDNVDITINQTMDATIELELYTQDYQNVYYDNRGFYESGVNVLNLDVSSYSEGMYYLIVKFDSNSYPAILVYIQ